MAETDPNSRKPPQINIANREANFHRFIKFCSWTGMHVLLVTGYLTLVFAVSMNWLTALFLMALAGVAGGWLMGLTSAWYLSLGVQAAIVVVARLCILLFMALS